MWNTYFLETNLLIDDNFSLPHFVMEAVTLIFTNLVASWLAKINDAVDVCIFRGIINKCLIFRISFETDVDIQTSTDTFLTYLNRNALNDISKALGTQLTFNQIFLDEIVYQITPLKVQESRKIIGTKVNYNLVKIDDESKEEEIDSDEPVAILRVQLQCFWKQIIAEYLTDVKPDNLSANDTIWNEILLKIGIKSGFYSDFNTKTNDTESSSSQFTAVVQAIVSLLGSNESEINLDLIHSDLKFTRGGVVFYTLMPFHVWGEDDRTICYDASLNAICCLSNAKITKYINKDSHTTYNTFPNELTNLGLRLMKVKKCNQTMLQSFFQSSNLINWSPEKPPKGLNTRKLCELLSMHSFFTIVNTLLSEDNIITRNENVYLFDGVHPDGTSSKESILGHDTELVFPVNVRLTDMGNIRIDVCLMPPHNIEEITEDNQEETKDNVDNNNEQNYNNEVFVYYQSYWNIFGKLNNNTSWMITNNKDTNDFLLWDESIQKLDNLQTRAFVIFERCTLYKFWILELPVKSTEKVKFVGLLVFNSKGEIKKIWLSKLMNEKELVQGFEIKEIEKDKLVLEKGDYILPILKGNQGEYELKGVYGLRVSLVK